MRIAGDSISIGGVICGDSTVPDSRAAVLTMNASAARLCPVPGNKAIDNSGASLTTIDSATPRKCIVAGNSAVNNDGAGLKTTDGSTLVASDDAVCDNCVAVGTFNSAAHSVVATNDTVTDGRAAAPTGYATAYV